MKYLSIIACIIFLQSCFTPKYFEVTGTITDKKGNPIQVSISSGPYNGGNKSDPNGNFKATVMDKGLYKLRHKGYVFIKVDSSKFKKIKVYQYKENIIKIK